MRQFRGSGGLGGGGGSGGKLKAVARAGVNGVQQDTFSSTQNNSATTLTTYDINTCKRGLFLSSTTTTTTPTSSFTPTLSHFATTWGINSSPFATDEFEWECVDEVGNERTSGLSDDSVFGSPPSVYEAEDALFSLQQVLHPVYIRDRIPSNSDMDVLEQNTSPAVTQRASLTNSDADWIEPSMQLCDRRMLQPHRANRIYDAFHLLQTDSCIQRMVISLSSDKAVWDAVLNNEAVRELRVSFDKAEENGSHSSSESPENPCMTAASVLRWIFENMKAKFTEAVSNVTKLVTKSSQHADHENKEHNDAFMEKLKVTFMLTVTVLLIVVATRACRS